MKLLIEIDLDAPSLKRDVVGELVSIFFKLADLIRAKAEIKFYPMNLSDSKGNRVGSYSVSMEPLTETTKLFEQTPW